MSIFSNLGTASSAESLTQPRDIFTVLPNKAPKYQYPRDVQTEVWSLWHGRRSDKDVVIKMNTGSGKTVVGLVILKSCLNEGVGPAAYLTPDIYLTNQVVTEAEQLGLEVTTDPRSPSFLRKNAILVTNIKKLVNGLSVFGVREEGAKIPLGSVLIDDAHACLSSTEDQFAARLSASSSAFDDLLALFRNDLADQSPGGILDIEAGDPNKNLLVPFWAWQKRNAEVMAILHREKDSDELRFVWPLIEQILPFCECVIGGAGIEISSRCVPIDAIPSFDQAKRRIFMTATLADDTILVTSFNVDPKAALKPITPSKANDVGDRLILIPQEINTELSDDDLKSAATSLAARHNVIVIVPSNYRAEFWSEVAEKTLDAKTLEAGVAELKGGHVGLVVIVNKYDGIDLPGDSCRILILDGLPNVAGRLDRLEEAMLHGTEEQRARVVQRIEQGMGRGIRSSDDWCAVLLMGRSLTSALYAEKAIDKLTPATRAQLNLSLQLAQRLKGGGIQRLEEVLEAFLHRDADWVRASKEALVHVGYDPTGHVSYIGTAQRDAFQDLQIREYDNAEAALQRAVNNASDDRTRGWLKQQLAEIQNFSDPLAAQLTLKSAVTENRLVLKPIEGLNYERLQVDKRSQPAKAVEYVKGTALSANNFMILVHSTLDDLRFVPRTSVKFERALVQLGTLLGFDAHRPEAEFGSGPDVLWSLGELKFLVIECKNGATSGKIAKSDCNQLTGSMNWFAQKYDKSCSAIPVMVHPSRVVEDDANPLPTMRAFEVEKLSSLKSAVLTLVRGFTSSSFPPNELEMSKQLSFHKLDRAAFVNAYSSPFKKRA